jgi:hypothetical protein
MAKKIVRGMRPQDIKVPKLLDKFTVMHLSTFSTTKLWKLSKVIECPCTKSKLLEAMELQSAMRRRSVLCMAAGQN